MKLTFKLDSPTQAHPLDAQSSGDTASLEENHDAIWVMKF